jgi:hypothetical protein
MKNSECRSLVYCNFLKIRIELKKMKTQTKKVIISFEIERPSNLNNIEDTS